MREGLLPLAASLILGAVGLLVLGVQPLLYGSYVHEGRITEASLGLLAAIEISAIALGSAGGIALLGRMPARLVALAGVILTIAANLLPAMVPLLLARALSGAGGGLLVAIAAAAIARRSGLNAAAAAFLFLQAASQYAILQWFSAQTGAASAAAVQQSLAVIVAITVLVLPLVPASLAPLHAELAGQPATRLPPLSGWIALVAVGLVAGACIGVWAYMGLWLEARGIAAERITPMLTASMVGQMIGTLSAIAIGERGHSGTRVIAMAILLLGIVAALLLRGAEGAAGWALVVGYGFVWMVVSPALTGFLLEADPTRRSLPFGASAQLLGAAILPTLVGVLFAEQGLDTVILASAIALVASLALILAAFAARPRPSAYPA
ncbi:MAG: hypothetical protein WCL10_18235 [Novosphingobium sp.]|uniref:hypothetical protein n=1 Tax=Novosphingobium sp. TaxID=1874826 RepID=UPI00301A9496